MTYRIIDHDGDHHVTAENEQGERLNFNVSNVLNLVAHQYDPNVNAKGLRTGGIAYVFEPGGVLPAHSHKANTLHNIEVVQGTVIVHKDSGDVTATVGDVIQIAVDEVHSIKALTPARTVHWHVGGNERV